MNKKLFTGVDEPGWPDTHFKALQIVIANFSNSRVFTRDLKKTLFTNLVTLELFTMGFFKIPHSSLLAFFETSCLFLILMNFQINSLILKNI